MKTAILSAALMLASTVAMAQKSNFQLKVDLKNFNSDSVLVYKGRNVKMDTVLVKNGKFTYSANLDKAAGYVFLSPEAYRGAGQFMFNLPCVPGEKAEVKGHAKTRFDISGSKFYQQYHEVDVLLENANKELRDYEASLNQRIKNGEALRRSTAQVIRITARIPPCWQIRWQAQLPQWVTTMIMRSTPSARAWAQVSRSSACRR